MLLLGNFLFNVFCGFFPCDPTNPFPSDPLQENGNNLINSNLISSEPVAIPIVYTKSGGLEGYIMKTIKRRSVYAFEGIPYAESTAGSNRFRPPREKIPWSGVRSAKKTGPFCLQIYPHRLFRTMGNEDCLFLNIYTTKLPSDETKYDSRLPVIFYIHGGSYSFHSGSEFGPAYLLDEDVILVTLNYRLGVLGFLSVGDDESPGNNGLRDQEVALKWIYENVEFFGGDRNRITLMGHSAGASSVHFHMIANRTRQYFRNGISLSGTVFHQWALKDYDRNRKLNEKLSSNTGCSLESTKIFVECLRSMNAYDLVRRQMFLYEWIYFPPALYGPIVEHKHDDAVFTEHPEEIYHRNGAYKIPWIAAMTADEGQYAITALYATTISSVLKRHWNRRAPEFLDYNFVSETHVKSITSNLTNFYITSKGAEPTSVNLDVYGDMTSDRYFFPGTRKALQMHASVAPSETYGYIFKYRGKYGFSGMFLLDALEWGVAHGDDIFYMVNSTSLTTGWKTTDREYEIVKLMCNLIANFADRSEPVLIMPDGTEARIWQPIENPSELKYLEIDTELKMVPQPFGERLKFWGTLGLPDVWPYFHNQKS